MTSISLTLRERCVLFVLLSEARELTNTELYARAGVRLDGAARRNLNDLGFVDSAKAGGAFVHELTEQGTQWCAAELGSPRPERSGSAGGALYAVLAGIGRYLDHSGNKLVEVFRPDIAAQIEDTYAVLTRGGGDIVRLAVLRERLSGVSHAEFDRAITQLARRDDVHLNAEPAQRNLTAPDHQAAIVLGGTARHLFMIAASR